jgi:HEAT repeat protein
MALRDRLLGDPDRLDSAGLLRAMKHGSEGLLVRAVRAWGERPDARGSTPEPLLLALGDTRAAVRRAAADALGHLAAPSALDALAVAARAERTAEGTLALAVARVRCGAAPGPLLTDLHAFDRRALFTAGGPREPAAVVGGPPLVERARLALGIDRDDDAPEPRDALLPARDAQLVGVDGAAARQAAVALAALRHPGTYERLRALVAASGRRGEHALLVAFGYLGDPRAVPALVDALRATDVDPGRGFAQRRLAAAALGRIGLVESVPVLERALRDEAFDYEGRPGAGLGIQYPVRSDLLWALGEIAAPASVPTLVGYLANTHGSALGGFYLPAMDALVRTGPPALPAVRALARAGAEVPAANAVGVLAALHDDVRPWLRDARRPVRDVAEAAVAARVST